MGKAYRQVEGRAYRQEEGKACLEVVIQLHRGSEEGTACHWEGKEAFRSEGTGMAAYHGLLASGEHQERQMEEACQEGSRRAWLLHRRGFHQAT